MTWKKVYQMLDRAPVARLERLYRRLVESERGAGWRIRPIRYVFAMVVCYEITLRYQGDFGED